MKFYLMSTMSDQISVVIISSLFRLPVGVIPVGDRRRSGEVMISPFAFQVRSLQRLVKLETELKLSNLDRRSFLLAQGKIVVIQMIGLAQRCLGHCQAARSYFSKRQRPAPY